MSAPVTRVHREMACVVLHGYVPEDGSWLRGWCLDGGDGHAASWQWRQLNETAQAIADAEARGRAAERSRCVDIVAREAGLAGEGPEQSALMAAMACIHSERTDAMMRARHEHVGSATKRADFAQASPEPSED
jgi:hypothetical protein